MSTMIDPVIAQWLEEDPREGPPAGLARALAATRTVEQRSRLWFAGAWMPGSIAANARRPRLGLAGVLLIVTLLLAAALAAVYIGTRPRPRLSVVTAPWAQNYLAYQDGSQIAVARI